MNVNISDSDTELQIRKLSNEIIYLYLPILITGAIIYSGAWIFLKINNHIELTVPFFEQIAFLTVIWLFITFVFDIKKLQVPVIYLLAIITFLYFQDLIRITGGLSGSPFLLYYEFAVVTSIITSEINLQLRDLKPHIMSTSWKQHFIAYRSIYITVLISILCIVMHFLSSSESPKIELEWYLWFNIFVIALTIFMLLMQKQCVGRIGNKIESQHK